MGKFLTTKGAKDANVVGWYLVWLDSWSAAIEVECLRVVLIVDGWDPIGRRWFF
ncbi:hypothetical protein FHS27_002066 [Rhodopirellula rubra]|uniref:Uncharacterized protein n=1 Tax=Aporhodopirellula rubra TaxID=980271 RepID=A0A7W5H4D3_9BACT|nr:hypothetical protein [Aporhodopirellula rubra]